MFSYGNYRGLKKSSFFRVCIRLPSQTQDEFEEFCNDLNLLFSNVKDVIATLLLITGDLMPNRPGGGA